MRNGKALRLVGSKWGRFGFVILVLSATATYGYRTSPALQASTKAVMTALADPASFLAGRSPGARTDAKLRQSKLAKSTPQQRVLGEERTRAPEAPAVLPTEWFNPVFAQPDLVETPALPAGTPLALTDGPIPSPGGGWAPYFPGGGIVIPGGPPPVPDEDQPPVTIPVPEPATWMIMALGLFAIGWRLRSVRPFRLA